MRDRERRARVALHGVGRAGRPAREHVEHEGRGALRRRSRRRRSGPGSGRGCSNGSGPVVRVDRVGAPVAAPEPRARARTAAGAARGGAARRARSGSRRSRRARRRSAGSTRSASTATSSATGGARRARSRRCTTFVDVLLIVVGVAAVVIVLDAAVRTFVVPRGSGRVVHGRRLPRGRGASSRCSRRRAATYEARDRVHGVVRADRAARAADRLDARRLRRVHVHLRRARAARLAQRAHRRAGRRCSRSASSARPTCPSAFAAFTRSGDRPRAPGAADRVPPDDLQLVLAARGRGHRSRDPRRNAADAARTCSSARTSPASSTRWTGSGSRGWRGSPRCRRRTRRTARSRSSVRRTRTARGSPRPARCSTPPRCGSRCSTSRGRPHAPLCIRSGYLALREVAGFFGFDYDDSPAPDDPISVTRDEFDELCDRARRRPACRCSADRDQAWRDFAGWRVNYDRVLHHARRRSSWLRTRRGCRIVRR